MTLVSRTMVMSGSAAIRPCAHTDEPEERRGLDRLPQTLARPVDGPAGHCHGCIHVSVARC
jgi:hypothetical protein